MTDKTEREQVIKALAEMISDVDVVMLTTVHTDGTLRSRPMARAQTAFDGELWFFTDQSSAKVGDVMSNAQVNVAYANPGHRRYLSISGTVTIVDDRKKMELLWDECFRQWLPHGPEDPELSILKVDVEYAEYWDAPSGVMRQVGGLMKGVFTGRRPPVDEHEAIDWMGDRHSVN